MFVFFSILHALAFGMNTPVETAEQPCVEKNPFMVTHDCFEKISSYAMQFFFDESQEKKNIYYVFLKLKELQLFSALNPGSLLKHPRSINVVLDHLLKSQEHYPLWDETMLKCLFFYDVKHHVQLKIEVDRVYRYFVRSDYQKDKPRPLHRVFSCASLESLSEEGSSLEQTHSLDLTGFSELTF